MSKGGNNLHLTSRVLIMLTEPGFLIHAALSMGSVFVGYQYGVKRSNREFALFCAGVQPSIAIAMSLFDLGTTFSDMQNVLSSGGIYEALSTKMFHMVGGIGFGIAQEAWVQWKMPISEEEKRVTEGIKGAVADGVVERMKELSDRVIQVGKIMNTVPPRIELLNKTLIDQTTASNEALIDQTTASNEALIDQTTASNKILFDKTQQSNRILLEQAKQSNGILLDQTVQKTESAIKTINSQLSNHVDRTTNSIKETINTFVVKADEVSKSVSKVLDDASESFASNLKRETQSIATEAAKQGGDVITTIATKIADTLTVTTKNSLTTCEFLQMITEKAERAAKNIQTSNNEVRY